MSNENAKNVLKTPLYGNCRVQNPDGLHIFNCGIKKASWYLKRDLADVIQEQPLVIQLKFQPNGTGHANDDFYLQERQNICVCCGRLDALTKHHVVPYCYRKFFPEDLKNHSAYDVLPLCYECHEKYESHAQKFKEELLVEFNVPKEHTMDVDTEVKRVCLYASALLRFSESVIPVERYNMMMEVLRVYYGRAEIATQDIEQAAQLKYNTRRDNYKPEGQAVVESLTDIEAFIKKWRQHFLDCAKPEFMPKYWDANRPIRR